MTDRMCSRHFGVGCSHSTGSSPIPSAIVLNLDASKVATISYVTLQSVALVLVGRSNVFRHRRWTGLHSGQTTASIHDRLPLVQSGQHRRGNRVDDIRVGFRKHMTHGRLATRSKVIQLFNPPCPRSQMPAPSRRHRHDTRSTPGHRLLAESWSSAYCRSWDRTLRRTWCRLPSEAARSPRISSDAT